MSERERDIQNAIRLEASARGMTLWRNNVGTGWAGQVTHLADGSVLIRNPRPLHAGLCKGSSDLIGFAPMIVLPENVGQVVAQFTGVEVKTARTRPRAEQQNFLDHVTAAGGIAIIARGPEDLP